MFDDGNANKKILLYNKIYLYQLISICEVQLSPSCKLQPKLAELLLKHQSSGTLV